MTLRKGSAYVRAAACFAALFAIAALTEPHPAAASGCADRNAEPGTVPWAKAEEAVLCLINKQRSKRELTPLDRHDLLDEKAADHSQVMVASDCFAHACKGEPKLGERLAEYLGTAGGGFGENIAHGTGRFGSPRSIVRTWMTNEGNRGNILDPDFEHVGVGIAKGEPDNRRRAGGATITVDFGWRED